MYEVRVDDSFHATNCDVETPVCFDVLVVPANPISGPIFAVPQRSIIVYCMLSTLNMLLLGI